MKDARAATQANCLQRATRPLTTVSALRLAQWLLLGAPLVLALPLEAQRLAKPPASTFHQYATGLLARTTYAADSTGPYRVEIWDLVVGPGMRSATTALPGGAVFEVRTGSGRIEIERNRQELRQGETLAVAQGAPFSLVNGRNDLQLAIRAVVITRNAR
jgi:hypothetical protein